MNRVLMVLLAIGVFLTFHPSPSFAAKWVLMESDGQMNCWKGFRPGGRRNGPSLIAVFASREACQAARLGKPLPKPKQVAVAVEKPKPAAVPVKKKKKKKFVPPPAPQPPPAEEDEDSVVH